MVGVPDTEDLLEREAELAVLMDALTAARRSRGSVVVIDGPAGIGKSRLVQAARTHGRQSGMDVLSARGVELEREVSFGVAAELFAGRLASASAKTRAGLLAGHAGLAAPLFDAGATAPGDAQALVRGLYWLAVNLAGAGSSQPAPAGLVIAVDDAQWSDRPSLGFLAHLAIRVAELPVVLVIAMRSDAPPGAADLLDWLRSQPDQRLLRPGRLTHRAVAHMVTERLPEAEPAFTEACARVSGGNPFLAGELVRSLQADGVSPTARSVAEVVRLVPESVLRSVLVRLARLGEHAQRLAVAIAVLGDGAALRHAGALAELDPESAELAADALAHAHILNAGEPLSFTHPLIATAVHTDLPSFARGRVHRRAADLLAAEGVLPEAVAAHLLITRPDGDQETVTTLRRAAARTLARGDPAAAVHLLRRALSEPPSAHRRAEVLIELSEAEVGAGELGADARIDEALGLLDDPADRTRALGALGRLRFQEGNHAEAARVVQQALDQLGADDPAVQALVVDELSATILQAPLRARANARLAPLMAAARDGRFPQHPGLLAHVALALALAGDPPELVLRLAERATAADPLVDPASHGMLAGIVVQGLVCIDELDAAERIADAALQAAQRLGSLLAYASASFHRAIPRYHRGALSDALADLDQALTASREGWTAAEGWIGALQAHVYLQRGELEAARDALTLTADMAPQSMHRPIALFARAQVKLADSNAVGALTDARAAGQQLISDFGIDNPGFLPWRCTAALAAKAAGDPRQADRLAGEALERAQACGVPRAIGQALRTAATLADNGRAITLLEEAATALKDSPSMLERAHTLVDLGGAQRRAGHREAAQTPLRQGLELADQLGAIALAESARQELRATGARPRRAAYTGAAALTPTERRVAELAAQGMTNQEIAQALFVTTHTIHSHLARAYRKLDIQSRRQLADALTDPRRSA